MTNLAQAIRFASIAHANQLDKGGKPYILHPLRVMMGLQTTDEELMSIAVLHDVREDCGITCKELYASGFSERVVDGVSLLTRHSSVPYEIFIENLAGRKDALLVKRQDLRDNSDLTRLKGVTEKDLARLQKYAKAYTRVEELLRVL